MQELTHNDLVATIDRLFDKGLLRSSRKTRHKSSISTLPTFRERTIETLAERGVFDIPQIEETSFAGVDGRNPTFCYNPRIPWQG